ncbi:NHLP leader peptide family RiPP precursor [Cumulibacter manganitolerans]|uniref:NHLP leader peptide family RiPP precursor n=1 Tax=Cumulibacter manganitolerans TaxID=1884992 RepID=UPI001885EBF1|nr:NHLP leader peptide family RiPP precursor [Cumulibacter manganitolerans]
MKHEESGGQAEINSRVLRDDGFRAELLSNPVETLKREYGIGVPDGVRVEVHEETDDVIHLVVPGRIPSRRIPDEVLDDIVTSMMRADRTGCCTCGASTSQTFSSIQNGCGC